MSAANRLIAGRCDGPGHSGATGAGAAPQGDVRVAAAFATLLAEDIGDTNQGSICDWPVRQAEAGDHTLAFLSPCLRVLEIVSRSGCGRFRVGIRQPVPHGGAVFDGFPRPLRVAVMGCGVNGPGESREAGLGVSFGEGLAPAETTHKSSPPVAGDTDVQAGEGP
ncbi:hypothetical protein Sros01_59260 [Streptomyces roseochromogenus]|nr:hypothetical protein Sros01_59260 [Streptomyces roseochromogenus]